MRLAALLLALACSTTACLAEDASIDPDEEDGDRVAESLGASGDSIESCADPGAIVAGDSYYVTCTGSGFPIYKSESARGPFTKVGRVFRDGKTPSWSTGDLWAPEIHKVSGGYAVYFSATNKTNGKHAIGVAFSSKLEGPYDDMPSQPLVASSTSKIDAHVFADSDGQKYLYWKVELFDGAGRQDDVIRVQKLSGDGRRLLGAEPTTVLTATEAWEEGVVEGPWVVRRGDFYYLFYSGAYFCNNTYGLGVARSRSPLGPFVKYNAPGSNDGRILKGGGTWLGPGHNSVVRGPDGVLRTFFHAFLANEGKPLCGPDRPNDNNHRHALAARIVFKDGWPRVAVSL